jgi:hypothetical protein
MRTLWPVWAVVAALALAPAGMADDQIPVPPEPNSIQTVVPRGGPVWIPLSAYAVNEPIMRYKIRRMPKGHIGVPQILTADTARVIYEAPEGVGPGEDSFTYQIQSAAGVSAPAEVFIKITDRDPQLIAPGEIDFGQALPGGSAQRELVVQNIGGGVAEGKIVVPDPWTVEGDAAYKLRAGEKQTFKLRFTPTAPRQYTGDVEYTSDLQAATDLAGQGLAPIVIDAGPVELRQEGPFRLGTIQIENQTGGARTFRVMAGPQVEADATVDAPANGVAEIAVRVKPGIAGAIRDHVTVQGEGVNQDIAVYAAAMAAPTADAVAVAPAQSPAPTRMQPAAVIGNPAPSAVVAQNAPAFDEQDEDSEQGDNGSGDSAGLPIWPVAIGKVEEHEAWVGSDFKGASGVQTYRVESQSLGVDDQGAPVALWNPFPRATTTTKGTMVIGDLSGLQPSSLYVVRLAGLDGQGQVVAISASADIWTPKAGDWWVRWRWPLMAAAAAGIVAIAVAWKKRRR